jgi:LPXTG-motif cell wall anchor domain protein
VGAGVERTVLVTEDEVITHQTEYRNDESLAEGETRVFQEGQDGLIHKTFEKYYFNDEERSSTLVDTKIIRKAVTRVILVGTKQLSTITTEELVEVEVVAFEKRIVENPNKAEGTVALLQEGKTGKRQYKYRLTIQEGRVIKKELIQVTLIEEPVHEITELGTKVVKKSEKNDQPGNKVEELNHVSTKPKVETKVDSIISSQKDSGEIRENRLPNTGTKESWILSILGFILSIITFRFFNRQKNER